MRNRGIKKSAGAIGGPSKKPKLRAQNENNNGSMSQGRIANQNEFRKQKQNRPNDHNDDRDNDGFLFGLRHLSSHQRFNRFGVNAAIGDAV